MQHKLIQSIGIMWTILFAAFIIWIYATEPRNLKDVAVGTRVVTGQYQVNKANFDAALVLFKNGNYPAARIEFERADPKHLDFDTQFYLAYSFYREGCNWLRGDDTLYKQGMEAINRAIALVPEGEHHVISGEGVGIELHTPAELKTELEEGLTVSWGDLLPGTRKCR